MRRIVKSAVLFVVSFLGFCLLAVPAAFSEEALPKPGEVIDKTNYQKYQHLFPPEFLPYLEDGYDGLTEPWSITVSETKPRPVPKIYLDLSEKNRGKYTLNEDGYIKGGYDSIGLPFPDLDRNDPDFATKLMWNYEYRYWMDDRTAVLHSFDKRKGESVKHLINLEEHIWFINRLFQEPKPLYETPNNLRRAFLMHYIYPTSQRNFMLLFYRYIDPTKPDDTYMYLPSMRRVLRGEAGQRSTPIMSSTQAPDDFEGFDGRVPEFNFKILREQKVLGVADARRQSPDDPNVKNLTGLPFMTENYEVRDVYVVEVVSKNPKYPQSRREIYLDKENGRNIYWAVAWDRAGKVWKVWQIGFIREELPNGEYMNSLYGIFGSDIQFGMANTFFGEWEINGQGLRHTDLLPSSLKRKAR